jgi:hypothetical protein
MQKRYLLLICLLNIFLLSSEAQKLTGIWRGTISRAPWPTRAAYYLEMQLYQYGDRVLGVSYSYSDTSRFVKFDVDGRYKKRRLSMNDYGRYTYALPLGFEPCVKRYALEYSKQGRREFLTGRWEGRMISGDTSCLPGEVVLERVFDSDFKRESLIRYDTVQVVQLMPSQDGGDPVTVHMQVVRPVINVSDEKIIERILRNTERERPLMPKPEDGGMSKIDTLTPIYAPVRPLYLDRTNVIADTVSVTDPYVEVSLYDNAIEDDDTVTIYFNKKLIVARQRISVKPLQIQLRVDKPGEMQEILMQADNLGSIPPNTGIMVIKSGDRRHEVRLRADNNTNAVLYFRYDPPK